MATTKQVSRVVSWGRAVFTGACTERASKCGNYVIESSSHASRGSATYTTFAVRRGDGSRVESKESRLQRAGKTYCYDLTTAKAWAQADYSEAR
jgi:hypothetical protein